MAQPLEPRALLDFREAEDALLAGGRDRDSPANLALALLEANLNALPPGTGLDEGMQRSMADIRSIGTAVESYAVDNNFYPKNQSAVPTALISPIRCWRCPPWARTLVVVRIISLTRSVFRRSAMAPPTALAASVLPLPRFAWTLEADKVLVF